MATFRMRESMVGVTVDAVQLTWGTWNELCELLQLPRAKRADGPTGVYVDRREVAIVEDGSARMGLRVPSPNGAWLAVEDDWIVLGPEGELSACKPGLFAILFAPDTEVPRSSS